MLREQNVANSQICSHRLRTYSPDDAAFASQGVLFASAVRFSNGWTNMTVKRI